MSTPEIVCTAYPLNGCAHPQFCEDGCAGQPIGLTDYERGLVHQTIGAPCDMACLDEAEAAEYLRGYHGH